LSLGETRTAAEHLRELRDTAQEALREMRLLIFELRPPALDKGGLVAALQTRLDAVEARGGMQAELQVDGSEALPRAVQVELYNIAQEALNNALKHALARRVQVRLRFEEALTCLEVCDDGVGFEPAIARLGGGFGISGMKERAQRIGGTLLIESEPGKGMSVTVQVPTTPRLQEQKELGTGEEEG
jgi:signal transduction histidine kinase